MSDLKRKAKAMLGDIKIQTNPHLTKSGDVKTTYKGHPFMQWLSKYIPFDPDVITTTQKQVPDMGYYMLNGVLICHPAAKTAILEALKKGQGDE